MPKRFLPYQSRPGGIGKIARWGITLIALAVLLIVAYQGYAWFTGDMARRQAGGGASSEPVTVPPPVEVAGLAQPASAPEVAADPGDISDPSQRRSMCGYLAAELTRLNHEFKQPLPSPVIDRIATEIGQLQAQVGRYGCQPGDASNTLRTPAR